MGDGAGAKRDLASLEVCHAVTAAAPTVVRSKVTPLAGVMKGEVVQIPSPFRSRIPSGQKAIMKLTVPVCCPDATQRSLLGQAHGQPVRRWSRRSCCSGVHVATCAAIYLRSGSQIRAHYRGLDKHLTVPRQNPHHDDRLEPPPDPAINSGLPTKSLARGWSSRNASSKDSDVTDPPSERTGKNHQCMSRPVTTPPGPRRVASRSSIGNVVA